MKREINKLKNLCHHFPPRWVNHVDGEISAVRRAINLAGTVGQKGRQAFAVSDWMDIIEGESRRTSPPCSSTSRVLHQYSGHAGHQDFSEDTYRTLMAADSAVMVIDSSRAWRGQTIKLFKVCVMRHIPIFTFINKFDRRPEIPYERWTRSRTC